jgi:N-methylhydantoinase B
VATVKVDGEELSVDFDGTSPQTHHAGVNGTFSATIGDTLNAIKAALVPEIPNNEALFEPIRVTAPEGSLLNCTFPAPVKGRSVTCLHTHEAIYGALAEAIPDQVQAGTGIALLVVVNGRHPNGRPFNGYLVAAGGVGATSEKDGLNVSNFPVNCSVTPTEVFENHVPLLMLRKEFLPDSGGDGHHRGGLGQRLVFRTQGETPATITMRPNNRAFPPPGYLGGRPGSLCSVTLNGEHHSPTVVTLRQGDELVCNLPGGGGFGPPDERSPERRARDLQLGYTTR